MHKATFTPNFIPWLLVSGTVTKDIDDSIGQEAREKLAAAGKELAGEIGTEVNRATLSDGAEETAKASAAIPSLTCDNLTPELEEKYRDVARAANEVVSHLVSVDFFETADETLPPFDAEFLDECLVHALRNAEDASVFEKAGVRSILSGSVSEALAHTKEIERNVRWEPENPEKVSPMTTRGATEGVVDWLDDLGRHLWMSEVLLSEEMLDKASTHTQALVAAVLLLARGAAGLSDDDTDPEDAVAEIVGGIALHTHYQRRIPEDLSWITDEMRAPGAWAAD